MKSTLTRLRMIPPLLALSAAAFGADPALVASRLKQPPKPHPRLFLAEGDEARLRRQAEADPLLGRALAHVTNKANQLSSVAPVKRELKGRRLLDVSRTCLTRVWQLALAHRLTGEKAYAARAQAEMLAAASFTDWNPSHFLDVAEMTAALGIGYDWLYDALEPAARETIRQAIIEKGLRPSLADGWWVRAHNNWNQVCHGGLALGALAILEDEPGLAAILLERAVENVPLAMAAYAPDGAYPEGPGYWGYGTTFNVLLLAALESAFGTDFGLGQAEGFLESSDYLLHAAGPTGLLFNYSDCGKRLGLSPALYWFSDRRQRPSLLWRERPELAALLDPKRKLDSDDGRFLPFLLLWYDPAAAAPPPPEALHWRGRGRTPVGMHRTGWSGTDTYVAVKGGSPGETHAHMDVGSFVMDADGARWAEDLGMQSYYDLETKGVTLWDMKQDSQRWSVFRLGPMSHNILVVDGQRQRVKGRAPIAGFAGAGPMPHTIVDLAPVYEGQLARARRGVGLRPDRSVLIQDELEALDRPATMVRWGMLTRASVEVTGSRTAVLRQGDRRLTLNVLAPAGITLAVVQTEKPPEPFDAPNPGTCMVTFEITLPARAAERLAVLLTPGSITHAAPDRVLLSDLSDWSKP